MGDFNDFMVKSSALEKEAKALKQQANVLAAKFAKGDEAIPADKLAEVQTLIGQADEKLTQSKTFKRLADGEDFNEKPGEVDLNWRGAAPGEGNVKVDPKAWRKM